MIDKALCRIAAVAILIAGGVHLDLWLWHGYRAVHVIGPLFLLNAISAAAIAALLVWRSGTLLQLAGLGYAASSLGAFLISVYHGLFGFVEALRGTPQMIALVAEATAVVLLAFVLTHSRVGGSKPIPARPTPVRG